jgi:hypothetical protein
LCYDLGGSDAFAASDWIVVAFVWLDLYARAPCQCQTISVILGTALQRCNKHGVSVQFHWAACTTRSLYNHFLKFEHTQ